MKSSDEFILRLIIKYSDEISGTIKRFELNYDKFKDDYVVKNAVSMCILQIGELSSKLTGEFKTKYTKIPWRYIIAMRNRMAHAYESTSIKILWNTAENDIPELKAYCTNILKENAT